MGRMRSLGWNVRMGWKADIGKRSNGTLEIEAQCDEGVEATASSVLKCRATRGE
jgi:hypothetical protein